MSAVVNVEKAPGDEPGAGSVQQGDEANSG